MLCETILEKDLNNLMSNMSHIENCKVFILI